MTNIGQKKSFMIVRRATNEIVRYCDTERGAIKFARALGNLGGNKTAFRVVAS
jgi:hypothetical protein